MLCYRLFKLTVIRTIRANTYNLKLNVFILYVVTFRWFQKQYCLYIFLLLILWFKIIIYDYVAWSFKVVRDFYQTLKSVCKQ